MTQRKRSWRRPKAGMWRRPSEAQPPNVFTDIDDGPYDDAEQQRVSPSHEEAT